MLFGERIVECGALGMLHSVEVEQHTKLFIGPTLFFEGRRRRDQHSMDQLVTEVLIDLVHIVELVGGHESAGQLGSEYQPCRFGLLDLNNAHELARFRFENPCVRKSQSHLPLALDFVLVRPRRIVWCGHVCTQAIVTGTVMPREMQRNMQYKRRREENKDSPNGVGESKRTQLPGIDSLSW